MYRAVAAAIAAFAILALAGCGFGEGEKLPGGARLEVTRDFGHAHLYSTYLSSIHEDETVMRLLESKQKVKTSYGGKFVTSIGGLASTTSSGRSDWFYFVNGIEASVGAADRTLSPGDVVQWDYRRWDATMRVPAIVGAYPEPFLHGSQGKRLPLLLQCADATGKPCKTVQDRLAAHDIPASPSSLGDAAGPKTLRVVVGTWPQLRSLQGAVGSLTRGPAASGVFARFSTDGTRLLLLDELGHPLRVAPPHSGLVAATAQQGSQPVWVITGLDDAGLQAAANALDTSVLHDAFAVTVTSGGLATRLPLEGK